MSDIKDFVIENGELKQYKGAAAVVAIPYGVTSIGKDAFYGCDNLANVICLSQEPPILEKEVFPYPNATTLQVPRGSLERYKASDWNKYFEGRIVEIEE